MPLLTVDNFSLRANDRLLFSTTHLSLNPGERVGLIGANGSGKSTFLKAIQGFPVDLEGQIQLRGLLSAFNQLHSDRPSKVLPVKNHETSALRSLWGCVDRLDNDTPDNLSGGEWARRCLVQALAKPHDLLLLDEPSAHLDQSGLQLLLDALESESTFLLVTHDRRLLEQFCTRLWIIQENTLIDFPGTYSQWQIEKECQQKSRESAYESYLREKTHLTQVIQTQKVKAQSLGRKPKNKTSTELKQIGYGSIGKSVKGKQKALSAQARHNEKRLQSLSVVEKPVQPPRIRPNFTLTDPPQNRIILQSESLTFGYPPNAPLFETAHFVLERNHKVALLGENGSGKSTLLNLIRQGHPDIYRVPKAEFGFFSQKFETVWPHQTVLENVRQVSCQNETITRQILVQMRFSKSQWNQKAGTLSGGELTCLAFAQLFVSNANVLLIDEPGNYLDLPSREAIEQLLMDYEGTLLLTSHDSTFVNHIAQEQWLIEGQKITQKG